MINKSTLPAGLTIFPTDIVSVEGRYLVVMRDHHEIYRVNLKPLSQRLSTPFEFGPTTNVRYIFWEEHMPGSQDTLKEVNEQPNGSVIFRFANGGDETYPSWDDVGLLADELDADGGATARKIIKAQAYRNSPSGVNKAALAGATCLISIQPNTVPVVFTPPQG